MNFLHFCYRNILIEAVQQQIAMQPAMATQSASIPTPQAQAQQQQSQQQPKMMPDPKQQAMLQWAKGNQIDFRKLQTTYGSNTQKLHTDLGNAMTQFMQNSSNKPDQWSQFVGQKIQAFT